LAISAAQVLGEDVLLTERTGNTTLLARARCDLVPRVFDDNRFAIAIAPAGDESVTTWKDASGSTHTVRTEYRVNEGEDANAARHAKRVKAMQRVFQPAPAPPGGG